MKIGVACNRFGHGGGMERYAMDVVDGLHRLGVRPVVFARSFNRTIAEYTHIEPVHIGVGGLPGKLRDHYFSYRLRALKAAHGVDLLIGCNRTAVSDVAICGGTHLGHIKQRGKPAGFWDRQQVRLETAHYANARLVLAHSAMMADELHELYGIAAQRIKVLYPPIDSRRFSPVDTNRRAALRRELALPDDKVVFLFPSSGHARKGYPLLAEYFSQTNQPVLLAVAGRPVDAQSPNIRYLGYRQDIEDCYRAADFTILASRYEPFGLVGPESVLCGTPIVLARHIGCAETLSEQACLQFDPDRPESLPQAVERAVETVQQERARLDAPSAHLSYDPDAAAHVRALLELAAAASNLT